MIKTYFIYFFLHRQPNMEALQNLAYLDVDFNKLESLPQDLISALPSIIRIDVTNNTWRCDGKIKHLQDFMKTRTLFWLTVPRCYYPADMRGTEVENYTVPLFNPNSTVMTNKGSTSLMLNTSLASSAWRNSTEVSERVFCTIVSVLVLVLTLSQTCFGSHRSKKSRHHSSYSVRGMARDGKV